MKQLLFSKDLLKLCFDYNEQSDYLLSYNEFINTDLLKWKNHLQAGAKLFLIADNKNALRYDCGDYPDDVCFSRKEISSLLKKQGIQYKCYSIYPCLEFPQFIYADGFLPNEELMIRYFPKYNHPESVFEIEEFLIDGLVPKGLFHEKANSYLIECGIDNTLSDVDHVTLSADRFHDKAFATIIRRNETVEKCALFPEGIVHLEQLDRNTKDLKGNGIPVVEGTLNGNKYIMPFVNAPLATTYLKETLRNSPDMFVELYDRFVELIYHSSEKSDENEDGIILKHGYLDMVPLNAFYKDEDFLFFDQEFYLENCPAKAIIYRAILIPYCGDEEIQRLCPLQKMLERYGLADRHAYWHHYSDAFFESLRDQREWAEHRERYGRNDIIMKGNRKIKQMKEEENCFSEIKDRKVYVFGTGRFADKFIDMYHNDYEIVGAVDNDISKQNQSWKSRPVVSPEILRNNHDDYVMVCIKDYESILNQLKELGVEHIGIYDAHHIYPGRQADDIPYTGKPYHIGYCAGVYDLFHIGHVNIFRRAKEQCDYLIVGVVTDEGVRNNKHREPFIPFEERIEMVRSCKYVDEAVEIPYIYCRTPDMFEKYHFDVQFSGSDYEHDPGWLAMKQYLNDRDAEMVFFPYTETTSSTKIKNLIEKGLLE